MRVKNGKGGRFFKRIYTLEGLIFHLNFMAEFGYRMLAYGWEGNEFVIHYGKVA